MEAARWPTTGQDAGGWVPERALWCAVLEQAYAEAVAHCRGMERYNGAVGPYLGQSYSFMTGGGPDFHIVCMLAGIDPAWFHQQVTKRLEAIKDGTRTTWRYNAVNLEATVKRKRKKIKKLSLEAA